LIWRFVVNMGRRRLILFDINDYISDPSLIMEPPYFLALLLLPMFFWRLRRDLAAQFVVSVSLAILFVMFNPLVTPLIGSFVMPWILWRFVWLLPYGLIFAMASQTILNIAFSLASRIPGRLSAGGATTMKARSFAPLLFILIATLLLSPGITRNIRNLNDRVAFPYAYPTPSGIFARLNQETENEAATVLADWDLSVTIPAFVANAHIVAHRAPTTSEIFPADQQDLALGRLLDQETFFNTPYLTEDSVAILAEYDAGFVIANSGSELDGQLRLSPQWFEWLIDDQSFSLYKVKSTPSVNDSIKGNMALLQRDWKTAETHYHTALQTNANPLLALRGLAKSAHKQGQFEAAEAYLEEAITLLDLPILHYQMGQLYLDQGREAEGIAQFDEAQKAAPYVPAFHVALGDACLGAGLEDCAQSQYKEAVSLQDWSDETASFIAEADLWRQRGFTELGLPLYKQAFDYRPSEYNAFVLISVYRELGLFDQAITLTQSLRNRYPLSAEVVALEADLVAAQGNFGKAVNLLRQAVSLHEIQVQESTETRLALAQALINDGRIIEAAQEIAYAADLDPYNPSGYSLQGDLFHEQKDSQAAVEAYQRALELDPTRTGVYVALSNELRLSGGLPNDLMAQLQMALRVDEDEATLLIALGDQWQRIGNTDAAIDAYQAALEQLTPFTQDRRSRPFQSTESRAFAFARIAATYEDLGEKQAALNYLRSAIAAAPKLPWPQVLMGDALRRYNDIDGAVAAYTAAIEGDPEYVDAYVRLAELYEATGEPERAQSLYDQALELTGSNDPGAIAELIYASSASQPATLDPSLASDETLFNVARVAATLPSAALDGNQPKSVAKRSDLITPTGLYQEDDETDRAVQLYLQRLQQGEEEGWPEAAMARYHKELGDLFLGREELDLAIAAYAEALELDPWWPEARLGLAEALSLQGETDEALGNLETAVSMAPGSVEAQIALADALHAQGRATEAMTIYINTARKYPGNGRALVALARAWRDRDRHYLAEIAFLDTIATNPGSAYAYVGLAELKMDLASYEEAGSLLEQAIAIDRNNVSSYVRIGELEERVGDMEAALASYQHATTLSSSDRTINLTLLDSLVRLGDYATAMAYAQEALEQRPDDAELLLRLGNIERLYGNYAEALSTISAAQANDPANSRIYITLAEIYLDLGQPVAALSAYGQAIEIQPDEATGRTIILIY
jgi:superkiller protein 3